MPIKNIEPSLRLIGEYTKLDRRDILCIPSYQRAYSWTIVNCDKLWQDVEDFIASGAEDPYFFGTVIIDCSTTGKLNLIDGQQRTTTFLLLLKAMQLRISETLRQMDSDEDSKSLKRGLQRKLEAIMEILYKADDDKIIEISENWEKAKGITILENNSINELYKNDFTRIMEARNFDEAETNVHHIPHKQKDNKYTNFFRNFKFFYYQLGTLSESNLNKFAKAFLSECQVIEIKSWQIEQAISMFNSLNSTGMPLSDADIISAQLFQNSDDKDDFAENWKPIIRRAHSLSQRRIIDIDSVLQQFMYITRAKKHSYKLNEVNIPGVRKYYLHEEAGLLKDPVNLCSCFTTIIDIWEAIRDYPEIKLLLKFNENFKLFLISYLYRFDVAQITRANIKDIAICMLRLFALLEAGSIGYSSSKFKSFLFNENFKLVDPAVPISEIQADFDAHIRQQWNTESVREELMGYDKNILVYLNEYLYATERGLPFDFPENVNVEHIMPSSGHNLDTIRLDAGITSKDEFYDLVNRLGNKILLEEDINKSISNDWFKTKKGSTVSARKGYLESRFALADYLTDYPANKWKRKDIIANTEAAADRIVRFIFNLPQEQTCS